MELRWWQPVHQQTINAREKVAKNHKRQLGLELDGRRRPHAVSS
jgi:hypothetical protein